MYFTLSSNLEPNHCRVYQQIKNLGFLRKKIIDSYHVHGKFRSVLVLASFV